jgi:hypothetical protein
LRRSRTPADCAVVPVPMDCVLQRRRAAQPNGWSPAGFAVDPLITIGGRAISRLPRRSIGGERGRSNVNEPWIVAPSRSASASLVSDSPAMTRRR